MRACYNTFRKQNEVDDMAGTKEQREEWKRIGLCSKCGKNRPVEGGLTCQECRDKQKGYSRL